MSKIKCFFKIDQRDLRNSHSSLYDLCKNGSVFDEIRLIWPGGATIPLSTLFSQIFILVWFKLRWIFSTISKDGSDSYRFFQKKLHFRPKDWLVFIKSVIKKINFLESIWRCVPSSVYQVWLTTSGSKIYTSQFFETWHQKWKHAWNLV